MRLTPPPGLAVKYTFNFVSAASYIAAGLFFDAIEILPSLTGIGEFFSEAAGLLGMVLLPLIAFVLGARFSIQEISAFLGGDAVEIVPFVNDLPGFTAQAIAIVLMTRSKDIERAIANAAAEEKKLSAQQQAVARQQHLRRTQDLRAANEAAARAANDNGAEEERAAA